MSDLISRSKLIEEIKNDLALKYTGDVSVNFISGMITRQYEIVDIINNQPTVEAVPVVQGEFKLAFSEEENVWECSNCGKHWLLNDGTPFDNEMNFCPNCGADMRKKVE